MSHKCLGGCNKWIGDNRLFCISCELTYAGNGKRRGDGDGQERSGGDTTDTEPEATEG